jgi:hypothetical protein
MCLEEDVNDTFNHRVLDLFVDAKVRHLGSRRRYGTATNLCLKAGLIIALERQYRCLHLPRVKENRDEATDSRQKTRRRGDMYEPGVRNAPDYPQESCPGHGNMLDTVHEMVPRATVLCITLTTFCLASCLCRRTGFSSFLQCLHPRLERCHPLVRVLPFPSAQTHITPNEVEYVLTVL